MQAKLGSVHAGLLSVTAISRQRVHACWKACTPMLKRLTPSAMYARSLAASKVPGSASMLTSAPAVIPKRAARASRMRASCGKRLL